MSQFSLHIGRETDIAKNEAKRRGIRASSCVLSFRVSCQKNMKFNFEQLLNKKTRNEKDK